MDQWINNRDQNIRKGINNIDRAIISSISIRHHVSYISRKIDEGGIPPSSLIFSKITIEKNYEELHKIEIHEHLDGELKSTISRLSGHILGFNSILSQLNEHYNKTDTNILPKHEKSGNRLYEKSSNFICDLDKLTDDLYTLRETIINTNVGN